MFEQGVGTYTIVAQSRDGNDLNGSPVTVTVKSLVDISKSSIGKFPEPILTEKQYQFTIALNGMKIPRNFVFLENSRKILI